MSTSWFYTLLSRVMQTPLFRTHSFLCSLCSPEVYRQARVGASGRRSWHSWYQQLRSGRSLFPSNLMIYDTVVSEAYWQQDKKKKPKLRSFYVLLVAALCPHLYQLYPFMTIDGGHWLQSDCMVCRKSQHCMYSWYMSRSTHANHTNCRHTFTSSVRVSCLGFEIMDELRTV